MAYEFITQYDSPNYVSGRPGAPEFIVIHHWGKRGQNYNVVINWLCDPNAEASAHYVAEAGRVACIVDPRNTAWHAGTSIANQKGIGIELRPEATDGDYQTAAELIKRLRDIYGNLPIYPHKKFYNTECPGVYDLERLDRMARGAEERKPYQWHKNSTGWWYGSENGGYAKNGWYKVGDEWYAFDNRGYMIDGWYENSGKLYYLDTTRGNWTGEEIKVEHVPEAARQAMNIKVA